MAMEINSSILSEMQVPLSYLETLPKVCQLRNLILPCKVSVSLNSFILSRVKILHLLASDRCYVTPQSGRVGVGDTIYRYMSSGDQFSPEHLLNFLSLSSEHDALEIADRVEAAMYVWRRKASATHVVSKWENVTELNADGDKNLVLASRARSLLLCLKQRFPGLSQTTLDTSKIQYNKVMANIKQKRKNSDYSMFICIFLVTRIYIYIYTHTLVDGYAKRTKCTNCFDNHIRSERKYTGSAFKNYNAI